MASTKKVFMDPCSSLMLHMHRAFNSTCCEELLNLENFIFRSQTVNRKYTLHRTLSTVASSSLVCQCSDILYIKQLPHRNVWGEKNRKKEGEFWWNWDRIIKKRIKRYGVNLLYVEISLCLLTSIYYKIAIDMTIFLQSVLVTATRRTWIKTKFKLWDLIQCAAPKKEAQVEIQLCEDLTSKSFGGKVVGVCL